MLLQRAMGMLNSRLPKVISPKNHAMIDYAVASAFLLAGAMLWRKHKRAAVAAIMCGTMEAATSAITDYPGGLVKGIDFPTQGKIDAGMTGIVAMMPNFMGFSDDPQSAFFRNMALGMGVVTGMTDFGTDIRHTTQSDRPLHQRVKEAEREAA